MPRGPGSRTCSRRGSAPTAKSRVRLVKGSHILVPRLWQGDHAYILQHEADGRVVFALPYGDSQPDRHHRHPGRPARGCGDRRGGDRLSLRGGECLFRPADRAGGRDLVLCRRALALRRRRGGGEGRHPRLSSRAGPGARPQIALRVRRQDHHRPPPRRRGARHAQGRPASNSPPPTRSPAAMSAPPSTPGWRRSAPGCPAPCAAPARRAPTAPASRPCSATRTSLADLGRDFGAGLYEAEVRYLVETEFARTAEDILWRRTKLGLVMTKGEQQALAKWLGTAAAARR